jgi:hypothetical protein
MEVGVQRHGHHPMLSAPCKDIDIGSRRHPEIGNMRGIDARLSQ